ncbi:hypothetical protein GEMRC1_010464 [Eukaryota sp. GEM-RC1]
MIINRAVYPSLKMKDLLINRERETESICLTLLEYLSKISKPDTDWKPNSPFIVESTGSGKITFAWGFLRSIVKDKQLLSSKPSSPKSVDSYAQNKG